jgi:ABC-type sulfate transport system permease subunit
MTDPTTTGIPGIGLSIIRTFIPAVVGAVVTLLTKIGANVDSAALEVGISTIITGLYYAGVRVLEVKVGPKFGWLLGAPKAPTY